MAGLVEARRLMVYWGRQHIGSRQWSMSSVINYSVNHGYEVALNPKGLDSRAIVFGFKCNLFVADMAALSHTKTWLETVNSVTPNRPNLTREPTAKEWANGKHEILGWIVVPGPAEPGDVASNGVHMGIVSDPTSKLISASSKEGRVNEVTWPMEKAVLRRFVGLTEKQIHMMSNQAPKGPVKRCF